jgi:DNA-binding NtrC family response regulator
MFGHSRGAFTGATQARAGLIRSACQGTLFLDEIDSLPASAQAKLLRFLETGEYRAVGSDRPERSDAWVIAATNQDLHRRVDQEAFRADLLYRLTVVRVDLPSLAQRGPDIVHLAEHFLRQCGCDGKRFDDAARRAMLFHAWPGNIRELKHRVESAALLGDGPVIDPTALGLGHVPHPAGEGAPRPPEAVGRVPLERELWSLIEDSGMTLSKAVELCEQLLVQAALRAEGNNRTRAAGRLGIHVRTIFKKLTD